ncbi:sensor histidine kinase [Reichenbachiella ulvae]|uniref:histidine kinase n=1 Tax=Reichenbachiella ulvae TaxID=2980104 RepID=A0ABT3CNQ7_9BACT|nr:ATP-binding protein [Reichenbachiella ulvae]MCV9385376.1 ATP-binding protein [Reichenbachiella ulvae]
MDLYGIVGSLLSLGLISGGTAIIFQKSKSYLKKNQLISEEKSEENQDYERLKLLFNRTQKEAKLGIWDWDLNTNKLTWSDEVYNIFDQPKFVKPSIEIIRAIIFPEELEEYDNAIKEVIDGGYPRRLQYRIETRNHFIKHISEKREVIKDNTGRAVRVLGTIQDISKQTQTTKYLFRTKNNYRLLTQTLPVGIYRSNKKGQVLFVNQTMVEMFGYNSEEEMMHRSCLEFYAEENTREGLIADLEIDGMLLDHKIMFRRKDGTIFVGTESSQIEGDEIHGVIQDVTARNAIEEEKNELISTLQRQNEDLERFAHIISHNLRIPLVNLMGLTQIMDESNLSTDNKEILGLMKQSTNNLDMIIKDLNKTVSIRDKKHEHYEVIYLTNCLDKLKSDLAEKINKHEVTINSNISKEDKMLSIPGFMNNIFAQLLDNSIKFRHKDRKPVIDISYRSTEKSHDFLIEDNGIGIDMKNNRERLFKLYEKFYPEYEGRGVGLYMAYNQINALKGNINIESEPGKGTLINISIPKENHS